jgi:hypothetical protein
MEQFTNVLAERASYLFGTNAAGSWFSLTKLVRGPSQIRLRLFEAETHDCLADKWRVCQRHTVGHPNTEANVA